MTLPVYIPAPWSDAIAGFDRFMRMARRSTATRISYRERLGHGAVRLPADPFAVRVDDLEEYFADAGWGQATARARRATWVSFYDWARSKGHIRKNPARKLPPVSAVKYTARPCPDHVYETALDTSLSDVRVNLALHLARECGMRRNEIAQASTDDLDRTAEGWTLRVHGKGNKIRPVPVPPKLARYITTLPAGWLFPSEHDTGSHLTAKWLGRLCDRAMPGAWTLHSLRHAYATDMLARGADLLHVQKLLGHASPATTQGYVKLDMSGVWHLINEGDGPDLELAG